MAKGGCMDVMGVIGPLLLCAAVIAIVAVAYFAITSLRDRARERHEARLADEARARRVAPTRGEGHGDRRAR